MKSKTLFKILTHPNGTKTLVDSENEQSMHSRIGPEAEAKIIYAERAAIENLLTTPESHVVLYDVGMGTAANVLAVLQKLREMGPTPEGELKIFSFESKPDGLRTALAHLDDFPLLADWKTELEKILEDSVTRTAVSFNIENVQVQWELRSGDFYSTMLGCPPPDVIFFDFYSPKAAPELWTQEKFTLLRNHIGAQDCALYTYSAATPVRMNLLLAGFFVGGGISTRLKNETTVAHTRFLALQNPIGEKWLRKLQTSTAPAIMQLSAESKEKLITHFQWRKK